MSAGSLEVFLEGARWIIAELSGLAYHDLLSAMATVVRGGRWANDGEGGGSRAAVPDDASTTETAVKAVMALVLQRNQLGVAVYNEQESELLWSQCVRMGALFSSGPLARVKGFAC